ncbi:hypothetical protein B1H19_14840 [Streptomyces gilvosporeus]|uniref:Uncharacterized protein n=1 Tax=Streptomyces gilvosporeus TaxID=553510 RepID=A0A1V0TQS4_9ACTN|nr:hypothetical protein B1H19_14840 [Streptomyces gilvosporeus]
MRRCRLGSGDRLAHRPQSSIIRLCLRLLRHGFCGNKNAPHSGGDAAPMPTRAVTAVWPGRD